MKNGLLWASFSWPLQAIQPSFYQGLLISHFLFFVVRPWLFFLLLRGLNIVSLVSLDVTIFLVCRFSFMLVFTIRLHYLICKLNRVSSFESNGLLRAFSIADPQKFSIFRNLFPTNELTVVSGAYPVLNKEKKLKSELSAAYSNDILCTI